MKICTFFGNARKYGDSDLVYGEVLSILSKLLEYEPDFCFYCGGKGSFDWICFRAVTELKKTFHHIKICYISPYLTLEYQKNYLERYKSLFDEIIFPSVLDTCPIRSAYPRRNQWMIDQADIIFSYVVIGGGGSETAIRYAVRKKKRIIPIGGTSLDFIVS